MTNQELKKLSRRDLLEMLLEQSKELAETEERLKEAEAELNARKINIDKAGSIAEAALQLSGIFEAAEAACQQYTDNIRELSERQEQVCADAEALSRAKAEKILSDAARESEELRSNVTAQCEELLRTTKTQCDEKMRTTTMRCQEMVSEAKTQAEAYWNEVHEKLEAFCKQHENLQTILSSIMQPKQ